MYVLVVRFRLRPGCEASFDQLLHETALAVRAYEPETLAYVVHNDPLDPGVRVIYESYLDEAAFLRHEHASHTRRFLEGREEFLVGAPEVMRLESADAFGVVSTED